ncbi:amidohydrolase [Nesterenkonia sp. MY13]|uniref:Amidohydrolase n=1 Tax=Nesterenkonia sedimenti TaxID=1463632 RepID=A0A7X8TLZ9_9MICC|nr:amidohydrolase [Nesterenkonia sedimenti]NLS10468.1 amidohydrolase [Nesterenkonia sedimenti]
MPQGIPLDQAILDKHLEVYHDLHANPELSMQEQRTAEVITGHLQALGANPQPCGGTGVVGVIENGPGPVVAFRADIDGLPVKEDTGLPYASTATGRLPDGTEVPTMHACGHDTHITAALSMAAHLVANRQAWSGTLVLIFQPGEETAAGSAAMLADDIWQKIPVPEIVLGQHVSNLPEGHIHTRPGHAMALADSWRVTVHGEGAHGSRPHDSIDPITQAAYMITRLQTVVSRETNPSIPAVVTVGTISGGLKENVIAAQAEFTLNIRTVDEESRELVLSRIRRILEAEAAASGAPAPTVEELYRFPRCYNSPELTPQVVAALAAELGEEAVNGEADRRMGSEDVGRFADDLGIPQVFWWFGGHDPASFAEGTPAGGHSPFFAPEDTRVVRAGTRAAMAAVLSQLGN